MGPYRGGRVTAVAGTAQKPSTFYQGATGGGVWKTEDYGHTWNNISDGFFSTPSIGAIAVAQNDPNVIYVGTGSDGLRSNVIEGRGIYKSIDEGENWEFIGLKDVGQIGSVIIHPTNHNIVYVAAIGKAFRSNPERGIYKTVNGGETWEKVLFVSDQVGFYDIEFLPTNPSTLFASAWKAERKPWTIISGGSSQEGGIYKSTDGGNNWSKVTEGLPATIGKIDMALTPADSKLVYALVEAPDETGGLYKSIDQGKSFQLVSNHRGIRTRSFYYTNIEADPKNPDIIYAMATGYFKSIDGGKTWKRLSPPHGDNHDMWINPDNPDLFIQSNDGGANVTFNGGKTWSSQYNQPTAEIYQVEVDDQYPYWVYGGQQDNYTTISVPNMAPHGIQASGIGYIVNTGGCETGPAVPKPGNSNIVYSNCKGRFGVYDKTTGTEKQYYVGASNMYGHNPKNLKYRFQRVSPIHVSPHDPSIVYHCSQYVHKTTNEGQTWEIISPDLTAFESDKQVISGSPITRDITGEEFYSTIYSIQESTITPGLIWVGANDGPIHVTRDGGKTWKNVTPPKLPKGGRVDAVEPSPHDPAKAYACVLRYQLGDPKPYIYKTQDYGKSWELITNGIPNDFPVRVMREDPEKEGLLYAGTEYGVFVSFDDGKSWNSFQQNLPVTPVTDLKIHRNDLVMSTMGRGFWVLDNISSLRDPQFSNPANLTLFKPANTIRYRYPSGAWDSDRPAYPKPSVILDYFLPEKAAGGLKMIIKNEQGTTIATFLSDSTENTEGVITEMTTNRIAFLVNKSLSTDKGHNRFMWDMTLPGSWDQNKKRRYQNGPTVKPGTYEIILSTGKESVSQKVLILKDPRVNATEEEISKQVDLQINIRDFLSDVKQYAQTLKDQKKELEGKTDLSTDESSKLNQIKHTLSKLETAKGIYMKPMLVAQINYLYYMLNRADQIPGKDAYDRLKELKSVYSEIKNSME